MAKSREVGGDGTAKVSELTLGGWRVTLRARPPGCNEGPVG